MNSTKIFRISINYELGYDPLRLGLVDVTLYLPPMLEEKISQRVEGHFVIVLIKKIVKYNSNENVTRLSR